MTKRDLVGLFFLSLAVRLIVAASISRPGYMDVAYYAAGAEWLAQGKSLTEPFVWNYLGGPASIPPPGFLYWMPLSSILATPCAALFPGSFFALQFPFAVLAAFLPLVGYVAAWQATGVRRNAWVAGLLVLFSGFFFPYWTLPETFAPFAIFGSLALWLAGHGGRETGSGKQMFSLLAGLLVGLAHLTRADGVLLLPVVALAPLASSQSRGAQGLLRLIARYVLFVIVGYLLVMGPWFARNVAVVGTPLSPAGTKTLWLTTYDDLFCYGCDLSLRSYLAWGWADILRSKLWAVGVNLERFLAEDCLVFLLPFVLLGFYRLRRRLPFVLVSIYLLLAFLAHSLAFTFPGPRGGFFHASAPALPALFAAGAEGLGAAVDWMARRRCWDRRQAQAVFTAAAVVGAMALSAYVAAGKLPAWRAADTSYQEIGAWLDAHDVPDGTAVMVGNPPGFWYHTHRPAVVVPNGNVATLLEAGAHYDVTYVVLDANHPGGLTDVYERAEATGLELVEVFDEGRVQFYRLVEAP